MKEVIKFLKTSAKWRRIFWVLEWIKGQIQHFSDDFTHSKLSAFKQFLVQIAPETFRLGVLLKAYNLLLFTNTKVHVKFPKILTKSDKSSYKIYSCQYCGGKLVSYKLLYLRRLILVFLIYFIWISENQLLNL